MTTRRPNILLITTDQERWFDRDPVPLPAHARLRAAGTTFDRFYAASIACSAARSVMYTGLHAMRTGVIDNVGVPGQDSMSTSLPTVGTRLRECGYTTAYKGKWHLSTDAVSGSDGGSFRDALEPYGFSDYNDRGDDLGRPYEGRHRDDGIAGDAAGWLASDGVELNRAGRPWFLSVNLVNPHDIMFGTTDERLLERNRSAPTRWAFVGPPDHELYAATWELPDDPTWGQRLDDPDRPAAHAEFQATNRLFLGDTGQDLGARRTFRDYYMNCLRDADAAVGVVLDALRHAGLEGSTVVVYTSDHGELAGAHGMFGKGPCSYDENLRVPLIIVDPSQPGGRRTRAIGSQVDLAPTLLSFAGAPPDDLPGHDLAAHLMASGTPDDAAPGGRRAALFAYDGLTFLDSAWTTNVFARRGEVDLVAGRDFTRRGLMRTLIGERYKLSRYFAPDDHHVPASLDELLDRNTLELFDLQRDPHERINLAHRPNDADLALIGELSVQLSALISSEIGDDDGSWLPEWDGAPWARGPSPAST